MFGLNPITGQKSFKGKDKVLVTSVFYTLQGEGPFAGRPAVFVRLAHCNLACSFCDTNFDDGDWMTVNELYEAWLHVTPISPSNDLLRDKVLVITGGEPMLQPALYDVLLLASMYFDKVQIESNGLLMIDDMPRGVHLVVSPKCAETRGVPAHYLKPPNRVLARADYLKFVITAQEDNPYHTIPSWAFEWRDKVKKPIYVSPMNEYTAKPNPAATVDMEARNAAERVSFWEPGLLDLSAVRANHEYAAKYCLDHSLYLSMQMQLFTNLP